MPKKPITLSEGQKTGIVNGIWAKRKTIFAKIGFLELIFGLGYPVNTIPSGFSFDRIATGVPAFRPLPAESRFGISGIPKAQGRAWSDGHQCLRQSCRPDWSILAYPVLTMDLEFTHIGSCSNLLGTSPSWILVDSLSNAKQVTAKTPPAFLFHSRDDNLVPVKNV